MFIIFLDIDGVLLTSKDHNKISEHLEQRYEQLGISRGKGYPNSKDLDAAAVDLFSSIALDNLNRLIEIIEASDQKVAIVMSSAWREGRTVQQMSELFAQHSFSNKIIDKTDEEIRLIDPSIKFSSHLDRGEEIDVWLQLNSQKLGVTNFLIIDDVDSSMTRLFKKNFVNCNLMFGKEEFDQAMSLVHDKDIAMQELPEETKPEDLLNHVTVEVYKNYKNQRNQKTIEEVALRIRPETRSGYVTLFSKKEMNLPKKCADLIAEYDDSRPKNESGSGCSLM